MAKTYLWGRLSVGGMFEVRQGVDPMDAQEILRTRRPIPSVMSAKVRRVFESAQAHPNTWTTAWL